MILVDACIVTEVQVLMLLKMVIVVVFWKSVCVFVCLYKISND